MVIYQAKSEPTNYKPMGGIWPADVFDFIFYFLFYFDFIY